MRHRVDLDEISDGKIYQLQDMAKLGCQDCNGCSSCCQGMGNSITLDPYDYYRLSLGLKKSFMELLENEIELQVYDGVIIPSLKMKACTDSCYYLNEEGRCSIHSIRPSVCRLFPLGRYYHDEDFDYILQDKECQKSNRTKIKISKWIDTPNQIENRKFILVWYQLLKRIENQSNLKEINMLFINVFYQLTYDETDFYSQFYNRLDYFYQEYDKISTLFF